MKEKTKKVVKAWVHLQMTTNMPIETVFSKGKPKCPEGDMVNCMVPCEIHYTLPK